MTIVFKIRRTLSIENWRGITAIFGISIEVVSLNGVLDDGGHCRGSSFGNPSDSNLPLSPERITWLVVSFRLPEKVKKRRSGCSL